MEMHRIKPGSPARRLPFNSKALAYLLNHTQDQHGIQVKHGLGTSLEAIPGIIASNDQECVKPPSVQFEQLAFYKVSVLVLAGEVDNRFNAKGLYLLAKRCGCKGRVPTCIIGDGQCREPAVLGRLPGKADGAVYHAAPRCSGWYQLEGIDEVFQGCALFRVPVMESACKPLIECFHEDCPVLQESMNSITDRNRLSKTGC